jgi:hypothetical protein
LAGLGPAIHAFERQSKGVDTRIKSAQDDLGLIPAGPQPIIIAEKTSPESPE